MWALYKQVRRHLDHTGGGDGDEDSDLDDEPDGTSDDDEDETSDKTKKRKKTRTKERFSKSVLDAFETSVYYQALDAVYVFARFWLAN